MTMDMMVNKITRQINPFFSSALWALTAGIFHFSISKPSKLYGSHPLHYVLVCKIHVYMLKMILSILLTDILFLNKICLLLVYNKFCSQFDTNLAAIPRTKFLSTSRILGSFSLFSDKFIYFFLCNIAYRAWIFSLKVAKRLFTQSTFSHW